jgi:GT2 family glycosyltransferase
MISIVMAYYNRRAQLINTLNSIERSIEKDIELILVDDGSSDYERVNDLIDTFPFLRVIRLETEGKWYTNSCIPFNIGIKEAKGDIIVLQNPECYHVDDVLSFIKTNLTDNNYLSISCYALNEKEYKKGVFVTNFKTYPDQPLKNGMGWYNHSKHRPVGYHFCSAITKSNMDRLSGFDERFASGYAYDDDQFWFSVGKLGLNRIIVDEVKVIHQWHSKAEQLNIPNRDKLIERNRLLFKSLSIEPIKIVVLVYKTGGDFSFKDVDLLATRLHSNYSGCLRIICMTDFIEPCKFSYIEFIPLTNDYSGWWSKLELFKPEMEQYRPFLYVDLDTAIVGNIDSIFPSKEKERSFITLEDFYRKGVLASGMMWIPANNDKVKIIWNKRSTKLRGDQDYIGSVVKADYFWQNITNKITSFKPKGLGWLTELPKQISIVCFHGKPRPREAAKSVKWVNDYIKGTL